MDTGQDGTNELAPPRSSLVRRAASPLVIAVFIVTLLWMGFTNDYSISRLRDEPTSEDSSELLESSADTDLTGHRTFPDFGQYAKLQTVQGDWLEDQDKRLILIGDIHGMANSFEALLEKVDYKPAQDTLIHLGDIVAKGPMSLEVLDQLSRQNITGVRGNHDQMVLEWRGYMDWVQKQKGGLKWFENMVKKKLSPKEYEDLGKSQKKFPFPKDWEWGSDHWTIARKMSTMHYEYLRNLPLIIHLPSLHTFAVHAGILPIDPKKPIHEKHQPLSNAPTRQRHTDNEMRTRQELSILSDIPQNEKPWTLLNMRSITKKGKVSRKTDVGVPWAEMWNEVQNLCGGFNARRSSDNRAGGGEMPEEESEDLRKKKLPCHPTTVVYGHAASRGLDIRRWSQGLDTGCVKGRRLTAMLVGDRRSGSVDESAEQEEVEWLRFGDSIEARIISVQCPPRH
ncbi:hypothetical protein FRB96_003525 [Tulasnella sp. 330]|nr:hypothetical protein FRB96_003525 [Tulasnella sp. 330]